VSRGGRAALLAAFSDAKVLPPGDRFDHQILSQNRCPTPKSDLHGGLSTPASLLKNKEKQRKLPW
jgi:hypothetical protein